MADQIEIDFGVVVGSEYDADGFLGMSHDVAGGPDDGGPGGAPPAAALSMFAFASRPLDADRDPSGIVKAGCGAKIYRAGDTLHLFPLDDPRVTPKLPKVKKGGAMMYCAAGSFALFDGEDPKGLNRAGSLMVATSYPAPVGKKTHALSMNVRKPGLEQLSLVHGEGHGLVMTSGAKKSATLRNAAGNRYVEVHDDGVTIAGSTKLQGSMVVGGSAAAASVALAEPLIALLGQLIAVVASITATTPGAPAAALSGQLESIKAQMLKAI